MKVATFTNLKGGVGKTMFTYNLGGFLAKMGKKVLLVDADIQANLTENAGLASILRKDFINYDEEDDWDAEFDDDIDFSPNDKVKNISHVLTYNTHPKDVILAVPKKGVTNLDIIPSNISLFLAETTLTAKLRGSVENVLKTWISDYSDYLTKHYDYIFIDVGPFLSTSTLNAFSASDEIYLVCDMTVNAYQGMKTIYRQWKSMCRNSSDRTFNIKGIIINRYDTRAPAYSEEYEYFLRNKIKSKYVKPYNNAIHESVPVKKTELIKPIAFSTDSKTINSQGHLSFQRLVDEMLKGGL